MKAFEDEEEERGLEYERRGRKEGNAAMFGSKRHACMHARTVMHDLDRYDDYGFIWGISLRFCV